MAKAMHRPRSSQQLATCVRIKNRGGKQPRWIVFTPFVLVYMVLVREIGYSPKEIFFRDYMIGGSLIMHQGM